MWSPSNTPLSYTNWNGGEPDNWGDGQDCLMLVEGSGKWNDGTCTGKRKYVCQQPH